MMTNKFFAILAATALAAGTALHTQAATKSEATPSPWPTAPSTRPIPYNGTIFTVDKTGRSFSTQNKERKIRVFAVTSETKITKNNKPASFDDLKAGDDIRGTALKKGEGRFDVISVIIGRHDDAARVASTASPTPAGSPAGRKKGN